MIDFSYQVCWSEFKFILSFSSKYHKRRLGRGGVGWGGVREDSKCLCMFIDLTPQINSFFLHGPWLNYNPLRGNGQSTLSTLLFQSHFSAEHQNKKQTQIAFLVKALVSQLLID